MIRRATIIGIIAALAVVFALALTAPVARAATITWWYDCNVQFWSYTYPVSGPVSACGWLHVVAIADNSTRWDSVSFDYSHQGGNQYTQVTIYNEGLDVIGVYSISVGANSIDLTSAAVAERTTPKIILYFYGYNFMSGSFDNFAAVTTDALATPFPLSTITCITATTSIPTPTRTPFAMTPTPGGPTPTRTPTPAGTLTPTPGPKYDSGTIRFETSLAPFSASAYTNTTKITQWENSTGIDNMPGVAYVKDNLSFLPAEVGGATSATVKGQLVLQVSQLTLPFSVSGYAKQEVHSGETGYINIWYFDPDYSGVGQGAWVAAAAMKTNTVWDMFSAVVQRHGGSGKVSAVAFGEVGPAYDLDRGIYFDNLRISSGKDGSHLPVCGTQGGAGGSGIGGVKQCEIKITYVDASTCKAPTGIDVPGWLSFQFCRLWYYFNFGPANRAQVSDLIARQNANEPIGTLNELDDSFAIVSGMLSDIFAINAANTVNYRSFDASLLLDWSAIDTPPDIASAAQADVGDFMSGCSDAIRNLSQTVQQSACWTVSAVRNSRYPFLSIVQWAWDLVWLIVFVAYFNSSWMWRLSGG